MTRHFGILVPATNTTCEIELCRLPEPLQCHTARLGKDGKSPFQPSLDADVAYQSKMLGQAKVEVIALAQTSASMFADDYDMVTVKRMTENSGGIPSLTSAEACGRAFQAMGLKRIAMATPYAPEVIERTKRYYQRNCGLDIAIAESLGATDSYAIGKMDAGVVPAAFRRMDLKNIDALFVPGGNFPTMPSITAWESEFGKPVITTNQAALWAIMRQMKLTTPMAGMGRLLAEMPAG